MHQFQELSKDATSSAHPFRTSVDHQSTSKPANEISLDPVIERRERRLRYGGLLAVLALFVGLGIWSVKAPLESAAIGNGVVVLQNYRKSVDHLEGGIVREVNVTEGQWVNRGDVLVALEDVQARAQLEQVRSQLLVGMAREARLIAQRDGLATVNYPVALTSVAKDARAAEAMRVQDQTFRVRRQAQQGEIMLYERQIAQLREKIAGLRQQKTMRDRLVDSYEKERVDFEALAQEGYAERQRVRDMERNLAVNEGQRDSLRNDITSAEVEISATQLKILQLEKDMQKEVAKELSEVQAEIFALREKIRGLDDTYRRTAIVAPEEGRVLGLAVHTRGEVLKPGAHLLDIVPGEEALIVEAKLSPQDVDQLRVGQMAEVRFTAFRQRDMPRIEGKLATLSADRMIEDVNGNKQPYYLGRVTITPKGMQDLAKLKLDLVAGMPADVLVKTGQRTFWHYLTAPLSDMLVRSLKED
jgi:epimerase transport system membrane fusion protein